MASNTPWKVRDACKKMVGQTRDAEDAAALVSLRGHGLVSYDHGLTVWREGDEAFSAAESYSAAAEVMFARINAYNAAALKALEDGQPHRLIARAGRHAAQSICSADFQISA